MCAKQKNSTGAILIMLLSVIIGMFMIVMDNTAVNIAIPTLVTEMNTTNVMIQWVVSAYTLAQVAVIPLSGWMTDRFGYKKVFLTCLLCFVLGSCLCAVSISPGMLICCRILQGLGGGMIMPIAFSLSFKISPADKVGVVTGMVAIPTMVAPSLGPVLAGWLLTVATWRWIFLINIPLGILAIILGLKFLPSTECTQEGKKIDKAGMLLIPSAFTLLCYGISLASEGWTKPAVSICLGTGLVLLFIFIYVELHTEEPLWELRVFKVSNFTCSIMTQWINMFLYFGLLYLVPLFLQQVAGFTSMQSALLMLPQSVFNLVFAPIVGHWFDRVGLKPLVTTGLFGSIIAMLLLAQGTRAALIPCFVASMIIMGIGAAFNQQYNTHLMQVAPREMSGRVMSLSTSAQQVFSSCAIAVFSSIIASGTAKAASEGMSETVAGFMAYRNCFYMSAVLFGIAIITSRFIRRPELNDIDVKEERKK